MTSARFMPGMLLYIGLLLLLPPGLLLFVFCGFLSVLVFSVRVRERSGGLAGVAVVVRLWYCGLGHG